MTTFLTYKIMINNFFKKKAPSVNGGIILTFFLERKIRKDAMEILL